MNTNVPTRKREEQNISDENPKTREKKPAIEQIYDAINEVLGGTNPQQMLCLTILGTVLDEKTYVYDTRFEKPLKVVANESQLANKIIECVLDSGSGAEVEEAREQVENAKKFDPDGGYVYPVTFQPEALSDINNTYKASYAATTAYVRASQEVADAARILMEAKSQDYMLELKESYQQLDDINEEME